MLYMDNIIVFRQEEKEINVVKKKLKEFYLIIDSSQVDKLLGICFTWRKDRSIYLDQQSYASQILEEFRMTNCKPSCTSISLSIQLSDNSSSHLRRDNPEINWLAYLLDNCYMARHLFYNKPAISVSCRIKTGSSNDSKTHSLLYLGN